MRRAMRAVALGASIGIGAMTLFAAAAYVLIVAVGAIWQAGIPDVDTAPALPPRLEIGRLAGTAAELMAAAAGVGAAAGVVVSSLRVTARADWRAFIVSLLATVGSFFLSAWAIGDRPWVPQRAAALLLIGLGVGALAWGALWTPLATALQQARGAVRTVWTGARRVAAFALALFAALGAAEIGLFALGLLVRAALGQLPRADWAAALATAAACALALAVSVLGLYAAGVPRKARV